MNKEPTITEASLLVEFNNFCNSLAKNEKRVFRVLLKTLGFNKYKELKKFYNDSTDYFVHSRLAIKRKPHGEKQEEDFCFNHIFIEQQPQGMEGDSYAGIIYIPITKKHYFRFEYSI